MRGRPEISNDLNKLRGNPGKRKRRKRTFIARGGKLGLPRGLSKTVQRHCSKYAKYLKDSGAPIDFIRPMFERYCKCLQFISDSHKALGEDRGPDESFLDYIEKQKHAEKTWKDNGEMALKIEKQFEVILRSSKKPKEKEKDPLKDFMEKGGKPYAVKK